MTIVSNTERILLSACGLLIQDEVLILPAALMTDSLKEAYYLYNDETHSVCYHYSFVKCVSIAC